MEKISLRQLFKHWQTVHNHRKWVRHYCFLAGIPWRGIVHDLSKYSPTEFFESARFWTGTDSPISRAKNTYGISYAWLHHRGRNSHHWAYWADNYSEGFTVHVMPRDDFVEMVCDFLGAAKTYSKDNFSYAQELNWWNKERDASCKAMHPINKRMLDIIFSDLAFAENHNLSGCPTSLCVSTPESLIKSGYLQEIWRANILINI